MYRFCRLADQSSQSKSPAHLNSFFKQENRATTVQATILPIKLVDTFELGDELVQLNNLGVRHIQDQAYQSAKRELQLALMLNKNHFVTQYNLGCVHYLLGDLDKAIYYFKAAYQLNPDHPLVAKNYVASMTEKGKGHLKVNEFDEAMSLFKAATEINPTLAEPKALYLEAVFAKCHFTKGLENTLPNARPRA